MRCRRISRAEMKLAKYVKFRRRNSAACCSRPARKRFSRSIRRPPPSCARSGRAATRTQIAERVDQRRYGDADERIEREVARRSWPTCAARDSSRIDARDHREAAELRRATRERVRRSRVASDLSAPLYVAWQITNECNLACLHCIEESGPGKAFHDELDDDAGVRACSSR